MELKIGDVATVNNQYKFVKLVEIDLSQDTGTLQYFNPDHDGYRQSFPLKDIIAHFKDHKYRIPWLVKYKGV